MNQTTQSIYLTLTAGLIILIMSGCSTSTVKPKPPSLATTPQPTPTPGPTSTAQPSATLTSTQPLSPDSNPFPLLEPGPYMSGRRSYSLQDASRGNRPVGITVYYPAIRPPGSSSRFPKLDAQPDLSGAPYPLILSSTKMAADLAPYLISHGFTWVSVNKLDTYAHMEEQMYEQPLDILFALDQVAVNPPEGLEGMIDAEHAGTIGYSFDGYNSLAMSGARIDPEFYQVQCTRPDATTEAIQTAMSSFNCGPADNWDEFSTSAGEISTPGDDGLWQPMTEARISAVMPLAGEGWWLFGERGLASADKPTLIIVATNDQLYNENVLIYNHLGSPDKTLISFIGPGHMMIYDEEYKARMAHFAVAFFGYHLQGREDLAWYYSEDFISKHEDLAWGEYYGE
jgi:predicted dienelactone hydrolase